MDQKYSIDAKVIDSAEIGGFVSEPTYICVAHRCPDYTFEWPEEQESFTGWKHLIRDDTDERLRRDHFQPKFSPKELQEFKPHQVGILQGGDRRRGQRIYSPYHPIPSPLKDYDRCTLEHGGGCVKDERGARLLDQEEMMRLMYFTDRVIGQLKELRKSTAQRAIGHATCVLTHSKLYSGIFEMLESTRMVKVTAGDDAVKDCSVCHVNYSTTMPGSIYHMAVTANPRMRQVNGILQHTVMPTLVELRAAQKKDAGIMLVRKFVAKYARTDTDEIDVKDQKQKNVARNELPRSNRGRLAAPPYSK